jgi:hypothetical protein
MAYRKPTLIRHGSLSRITAVTVTVNSAVPNKPNS